MAVETLSVREVLADTKDILHNVAHTVRRLGTTAVVFQSLAHYQPSMRTLQRNGATLRELHDRYTTMQRDTSHEGTLLQFEREDGLIGYNCSQAFQQTVENNAGMPELRWYIAVRTEIEGGEQSHIGLYYQPATSDTPPDDGVWCLDEQRQLPYDAAPFIDDPTPWKPDPAPSFLRPDIKNAADYVPNPDRSHETPNAPESHQDPSVTIGRLDGSPLLVMTAVKARSLRSFAYAKHEKRMPYHQEFFIGTSIDDLERVAIGPEHRKATRIVYLGENRWGVFNRPQSPQGEQYHPGVVTYAEFTATTRDEFIQGLQAAIVDISTVIPDLSQNDEWVGPNFGWPLQPEDGSQDRRIGMIGHIAAMLNPATGEREYCATSYVYNPRTNTAEEMKIIVAKEAFEGMVGRRIDRDDLDRVIYPGGAVVLPNGKLRLYCGISDLRAGYIDIDDPFAGRRLAV